MMRPRAGQRNFGSVPAGSACAPGIRGFYCDAPDSRLPVGVLSTAGFLASDDLDGSASATAAPLDSDADFSASLAALSALAEAFSFSLSFALLLADLDRSASATSLSRFFAAFSPSAPATAWPSA